MHFVKNEKKKKTSKWLRQLLCRLCYYYKKKTGTSIQRSVIFQSGPIYSIHFPRIVVFFCSLFSLMRNYLMMGGFTAGPRQFFFCKKIRIFRIVPTIALEFAGNTYGKHSTQESVTCGPLCDKEINFVSSYTNYRGVLHAFLCLLRILVCLLHI